MRRPRGSVLNPQQAAFVSKGVSILVASRDAANRPAVCRGCGCDVLEDGRLRVYVDEAFGRPMLESIAVSRSVAAVFSEPATHRTLQFKGTDAEIVQPRGDYPDRLRVYREAFGTALRALGYAESMADGLTRYDADRVRAVVFTPAAAFDQTPGPGAGEPVGISR